MLDPIPGTYTDLIQDPSIYHGKKSSAVASTSGGVTAFYSEDNTFGDEESTVKGAFKASSGSERKVTQSSEKSSKGHRSMPMSVRSAEDHLGMLASFVASYENFIQGKVHDPAIADEDYDQIDPDDLEEMDLQWQLAMIT